MNKQLLFLLTCLVVTSVGAQMTERDDELGTTEDTTSVPASADIVNTEQSTEQKEEVPSASDTETIQYSEAEQEPSNAADVQAVDNEQEENGSEQPSSEQEDEMLPQIANTVDKGPLGEDSLVEQTVLSNDTEQAEQGLAEEAQDASSQASPAPEPVVPDIGIDTLDQEGGNWLLKRVSLEKMVDLIEKINMLFTTILESRMDYLIKRNKVDRDFDVFAQQIDFELGDLDQLLETLIEKIDAERNTHGDLPEEERDLESDVTAKRNELKALQEVVKNITDMDSLLDDVVMQIEQEVNKSNNYQVQAWNNFQKIKQILSDEKAEELYAQTEGMYRNLQDIQNYLKSDLNNYFSTVVNDISTGIQDAQAKIKTLQSQGTDLKKEAEQLAHPETTVVEEAHAVPVVVPKKTAHWYDYFTYLWQWTSKTVGGWWHSLLSLFTTQETIKVRAPQEGVSSQGPASETTTQESDQAKTE